MQPPPTHTRGSPTRLGHALYFGADICSCSFHVCICTASSETLLLRPPERAATGIPTAAAGTTAITAVTAATPEVPVRSLYGALSPAMAPRLAVLPDLVRNTRVVAPGCLAAPAGVVVPVFCNVVGLEVLVAWERVIQQRAARELSAASTHATAASGGGSAAAAAGRGGAAVSRRGGGGGGGTGGMARADGGGVGGGGGAGGSVPGSSALTGGAGVVQAALRLLRAVGRALVARHGGYVVASSWDGAHWVGTRGCIMRKFMHPHIVAGGMPGWVGLMAGWIN